MGTRYAPLPDPAAAGAAKDVSDERARSRSRPQQQSSGSAAEYTVIYDGNCNVCSRIASVLERRDKDKRLEIVASGAEGVASRYPWISPGEYKRSLQVVRAADNRTWQGAAAVEQVLDVLPKGRLVSWIFSIPFARPIAEKVYRSFARNRYRLGCKLHS